MMDPIGGLLDFSVLAFFVYDEVQFVDALEDDSDVDLLRQIEVIPA